jgi:hypothetical protein
LVLANKANGTEKLIVTNGKRSSSNSLVGCGRSYFHLKEKMWLCFAEVQFQNTGELRG